MNDSLSKPRRIVILLHEIYRYLYVSTIVVFLILSDHEFKRIQPVPVYGFIAIYGYALVMGTIYDVRLFLEARRTGTSIINAIYIRSVLRQRERPKVRPTRSQNYFLFLGVSFPLGMLLLWAIALRPFFSGYPALPGLRMTVIMIQIFFGLVAGFNGCWTVQFIRHWCRLKTTFSEAVDTFLEAKKGSPSLARKQNCAMSVTGLIAGVLVIYFAEIGGALLFALCVVTAGMPLLLMAQYAFLDLGDSSAKSSAQ